jgi:outer membrane protein assembly factor BamB
MMSRPRDARRFPAVLGLCLALALAAGCASKKDKADPPADLVKFKETVKVTRVWSDNVGGANPKLRLGLGVAVDGDRVFAAGHKGDVYAYALATGKPLWHVKTKAKLSGGPGAGAGVVVVGASYGDVIALDEATGAIRWKTRVNSEILSAPAIGGERVVLRSVDGRLHGLALADGKSLWTAEQPVPKLSLRGVAIPSIAGEFAVSGFDNGRMLAVSLRDGATAWEAIVAPPSGRSELDRLVDIDSTVGVVDDDLYAVSYQGRVARVARDTGQIWWTRDISSYRGLATDEDGVYVSTADGQVVKIGRRTGVEMWRTDVLKNRRLSAPAVLHGQVVVADFKGYVHFLDASTGTITAREKNGSERVSTPPVVAKDLVIFMNDKGHLAAFRIAPKG